MGIISDALMCDHRTRSSCASVPACKFLNTRPLTLSWFWLSTSQWCKRKPSQRDRKMHTLQGHKLPAQAAHCIARIRHPAEACGPILSPNHQSWALSLMKHMCTSPLLPP
eukprot:3102458-Amphidinium_carterae.1